MNKILTSIVSIVIFSGLLLGLGDFFRLYGVMWFDSIHSMYTLYLDNLWTVVPVSIMVVVIIALVEIIIKKDRLLIPAIDDFSFNNTNNKLFITSWTLALLLSIPLGIFLFSVTVIILPIVAFIVGLLVNILYFGFPVILSLTYILFFYFLGYKESKWKKVLFRLCFTLFIISSVSSLVVGIDFSDADYNYFTTVKNFIVQLNFGPVRLFSDSAIYNWVFNANAVFILAFLFWFVVYLFILLLFYILSPLKK